MASLAARREGWRAVVAQGWPFPGDSPVLKARRALYAYRAKLERVDPAGCAELDARMRRWGLTWIVPRELPADLGTWVSAADAADLAAVEMATLRQLRRRGRLHGRLNAANRWEYRVADVLALSTQPRGRTPRTTKDAG